MKIIPVIRKEYRSIVKKKTFLITTILTPLIMAGMVFLPQLLMRSGRGEKTIAVADYSGGILPKMQEIISTPPAKPSKAEQEKSAIDPTSSRQQIMFETKIHLQPAAMEGKGIDSLVSEYTKKMLRKELDGLLIIPADVNANRTITYYATNVSDFFINEYLSSIVRTIISQRLLLEKSIDPKIVNEATRSITMETFKVKKGGTTKASSGMEFMLSLVMLVILFSILIGYGQLIQRGITEEKSSRIMEVLLSSVKASQIFYGKIIGIALAGLTQMAIWLLVGAFMVTKFSSSIDPSLAGFLTLPVALLFILFFILGYAMYSILFAIVGASVNSDQEAQQFTAIITWIIIVPYIFGIAAAQNPNMPLVVILSLFPLFTPILMFTRMLSSTPPLIQVISSLGLSLATIVFLAWAGAKIFRTGILMYGKKPSLGEILRWVRYK